MSVVNHHVHCRGRVEKEAVDAVALTFNCVYGILLDNRLGVEAATAPCKLGENSVDLIRFD